MYKFYPCSDSCYDTSSKSRMLTRDFATPSSTTRVLVGIDKAETESTNQMFAELLEAFNKLSTIVEVGMVGRLCDHKYSTVQNKHAMPKWLRSDCILWDIPAETTTMPPWTACKFCDALIHFSYNWSGGKRLACNTFYQVVGNTVMFHEPLFHTAGCTVWPTLPYDWHLGIFGIFMFFDAHMCNDLCRRLERPRRDGCAYQLSAKFPKQYRMLTNWTRSKDPDYLLVALAMSTDNPLVTEQQGKLRCVNLADEFSRYMDDEASLSRSTEAVCTYEPTTTTQYTIYDDHAMGLGYTYEMHGTTYYDHPH